ncbi:Fe-S oxidoreductase [Trueperella pyogenes]|nr:Fe-S oxidoreductase [Trueperella pyogenes]
MTHTLAELLTAPEPIGPGEDWQVPDLSGVEVVAQPHCHHYSVMGWRADAELLRRAGAQLTTVSGCCGLAGNFGMEKGHYDVSVKVAHNDLLPKLAAASPDADIWPTASPAARQARGSSVTRAFTLPNFCATAQACVVNRTRREFHFMDEE